ncbi:unnamed protein product [Prorocentrum cordatum]|uniref:Uncharacterized protein n=1 Tax=Prorocentrum cordatum TaxID=2364126 RepID=A0ABN9VF75_9DINO|nr:unnamed protein product [Polarella glacialis]
MDRRSWRVSSSAEDGGRSAEGGGSDVAVQRQGGPLPAVAARLVPGRGCAALQGTAEAEGGAPGKLSAGQGRPERRDQRSMSAVSRPIGPRRRQARAPKKSR